MKFDHISVDDGLSQNSVICILQDNDGYMWFGTADGLNRYDGYRMLVYRHEPQMANTLPGNKIYALHEDRQRTLWIATDGG